MDTCLALGLNRNLSRWNVFEVLLLSLFPSITSVLYTLLHRIFREYCKYLARVVKYIYIKINNNNNNIIIENRGTIVPYLPELIHGYYIAKFEGRFGFIHRRHGET